MWLCPWFLYNVGLCTGCCSEQSVCTLPADSGPCSVQYTLRWYFDPMSGQCRQFMHGGCGGNSNNFDTKSSCIEKCNALPTDAGFCKMSKDRGPCSAHYEKWYYEPSDGKCHLFIYGGCDGNDNKFDSEDECLVACYHGNIAAQVEVAVAKSAVSCLPFKESQTNCPVVRESPERCLQPLHQGPCSGSMPRWYFDSAASNCLPFPYGGCHGNRNRFLTKDICMTACRSKMTSVVESPSPGGVGGNTATVVTNKLSPLHGTTTRHLPVFDAHLSGEENEEHKRNDAHGGSSKKYSEGRVKDRFGGKDGVEGLGAGVCQLKKEPGPCRENVSSWYFDSFSSACRRFVYGGCQGNGNRFTSLQKCQKTCLGGREVEIHTTIARKTGVFFHAEMLPLDGARTQPLLPAQMLPGKTGVRSAPWRRKESVGKDQKHGNGGLKKKTMETQISGNEHGIEPQLENGGWQHDGFVIEVGQRQPQSVEKSEDPIPRANVVTDRCNLPEDRGRLCSKWRINWFHDNQVFRCRRFYYGGCDGNENRFETEEDCVRACADSEETRS